MKAEKQGGHQNEEYTVTRFPHSMDIGVLPEGEEAGGEQLEEGDEEATSLVNRSLNYEERRSRLKLDTFHSAVLIFQATVGISLFTMHEPMAMVGLVWGFVLTAVCCYTTVYGLILLSAVAYKVEDHYHCKMRIKNVDELCSYIDVPGIQVVKWLMIIACSAMMIASSVSNLVIVGTFPLFF